MTGSLIPMYQEMHKRGHFWGRSLRHYVGPIAELVRQSEAETLLDYGCGKGRQYTEKRAHAAWGSIMPHLYDPAVQELSRKPRGQFDGVICTDVLEHVPEGELDAVIGDLATYAKQWCFMAICCTEAKKSLPDGRNVHVTLRPPEWWREKIAAAFNDDAVPHMVFDRGDRS